MILTEKGSSGEGQKVPLSSQRLETPHLIKIHANPRDIVSTTRQGSDLILLFSSGQSVTFFDFFKEDAEGEHSELILEDDQQGLWWLDSSSGQFVEVSAQDVLGQSFAGNTMSSEGAELAIAGGEAAKEPPAWILGLLLLGGAGVAFQELLMVLYGRESGDGLSL